MISETKVIRLGQAIPCGLHVGGVLCGRAAWQAYLDPIPEQPGRWRLTPVCPRCADELNALIYGDRRGDVMSETIAVSKTLALEIVAGGRDPVVRISRTDGGLVAVRPDELRHLVDALVEAAGVLASAEAARSSSERAVVEARRLRRRRVDGSG